MCPFDEIAVALYPYLCTCRYGLVCFYHYAKGVISG